MTSTVATHPGRKTPRVRSHRMRRPLAVTTLAVALVGTGGAVTPAAAVRPTVVPSALVVVESCTSVTARADYAPGLTPTARNQSVMITGALDGCTGAGGASQPGPGRILANLTGSSRVGAVSAKGPVSIIWPTSAGLNISSGTGTLTGPGGGNVFTLNVAIDTGAFPGAPANTVFRVTRTIGNGTNRRPVISHFFINTVPLTVKRNLG
jgi:hypothetical protein